MQSKMRNRATFTPSHDLGDLQQLDAVVLQFQNQKLTQKLETQKIEINSLEGRLSQLNVKQQSHDNILTLVNTSWNELVNDLELRSHYMTDSVHQVDSDWILETDSTTTDNPYCQIYGETAEKTKKIMSNVLVCLHHLNDLKNMTSLKALSSNGQSHIMVSSDLQTQVKNLRLEVAKLHLEHKAVAGKLQSHRDVNAKNKSELKCLQGELESTLAELEESNRSLAILKVEREMTKGELPCAISRGNKQFSGDKAVDRQRDTQDTESTLNELLDQSTSSLHELKRLHEYKLDILRQLSVLQSNRKNFKSICSAQPYLFLKDQLATTKTSIVQYQNLYERLQVEKESLLWREKEAHMKNDLVDVLHRSSAVADSRISDLEAEIQKCNKEKDLVENKLAEASEEPGRKEIISGFKVLVSSFPERMGSMQNELANHKMTAANIHCLRADVQSITNILDRRVKELETTTSRRDHQGSELQKLQTMVHDLELTKTDLNLFLDMYGRESAGSRELTDARSSELKAWAHVQSLKSSLDEHNLELQVKVAIEAEAEAQQRLAATEAQIADLRLKLDASRREKLKLSDVLKSKHEETEAFLSEIETIGQAYDDMQSQNQQLLQQITERDDYNIKLVLEGVRARQTGDALLTEKLTLDKSVQQVKATVDLYEYKAGKIKDQLKAYTDHIQRLAGDRVHNSTAKENTQRRSLEVRNSSKLLTNTLEETQSKVDKIRTRHAEMQIELEKERFQRKRVEEELETLRRKAQQLRLQAEGSSITGKLKEELREYTEILKCSVCLDRRKEVVITKCYHLFCNPCVQKVTESRQRKCPVCAASFGANDVKPVYI